MAPITTGDYSIAHLVDEAENLQFTSFDVNAAIALGETALGLARERSLPVTIEVWHTGRLVYKVALPGTTPDNDEWLRRKRNVVERFNASTMAVRVGYEEKGQEFHTATSLTLDNFAAHGGGWPIRVKGTGTVGFFGISGLPQVDDHQLIVECLTRILSAES